MKVIGLGVNNRIGQSGSILGRFKRVLVSAPVASGTLSNQSLQQGSGVTTYTTSGAFTGSVASWSMTGAGSGIAINASTGVVSVDRAVVSVNVFNLVIRATNAAGFAETGFALTVTAATLTLRQQIEGLKTQVTLNGRQSVNALNVASAGNLPAGCSLAANVMTFSGSGVTLEDWDFGGYSVRFSGTDQTIQNCKFGPYESAGSNDSPIQLNATSVRAKIRYNTFDGFDGYGGPVAHIKCVTTGSGAAATGPQDYLIEYNRFLFPQSDVIKGAGNGIIQWNYFGPLTNYPSGTTTWAAGTTYAAGQYVLSPVNASLALFRSFSSGNTGNSPATSKNNTAFWESLDPHGDCITQVASDGVGVIIRRNLIDWGPAVTRAVGTTQAIRIIRNNKSSVLMGPVDFSENVIPGPYAGFHTISTNHVAETYGAGSSYSTGDLIQSGSYYYTSLTNSNIGNNPATSPTFWALTTNINAPGPIRYLNNWIGAGSLGSYFNPPMANAVDAWSNNVDSVSGALIAGPVLRVTTINPVIGLLAQSQTARILNNGSTFRAIAQPANAGAANNVITYIDNDTGSGPVKYSVTPSTVSAGNVNPTVAAWGVFWDYVMPGTQFTIVDLAVVGTGRLSIAQDGHSDNRWPGFSSMLSFVRADVDDLDAVIDIWQGNDSTTAKTFSTEWAPFYTGQRANGSSYTVGTANPDSVVNSGQVLNHILWDIEADPATTGRGVFKRNRTKLYFTGWATYSGSLAFPAELRNSSTDPDGSAATSYPSHFDMPARSKIDEFIANYPSFTGEYIGMTHAANMLGGVHASTTDPEGQILIGWGIAVAALKVAGLNVFQPVISGIETATNGSYADVLVSLKNGGDLTTYEALQSLSPAAIEPPHYQPVMGFEIRRAADADNARRPVYKTSETTYPVNYRGTVAIQSSGVGTGETRVGRIRITPVTPFANGDMIYFGRGDASMMLQNPRDVDAKLYRRQPLENIASFYDVTATYPCPGIWIKPQPPVLTISGVGGVDVTAPVLSGISLVKNSTTATLSWSTTDANGTAYWLVDTNATRTSAQVISGGGAASGSRVVTVSGAQSSFTATGLTASTAYYFHLVHVDAAGNISIVSDTAFTTDAAAAPTFFTSSSGPWFVGQTDLPTTSKITFSFRVKPSATGATRYLLNYASTSILADVTTGGDLRVGIKDGSATSVRAMSVTGVTVENDVWTSLIISIDLSAATLQIRKNGVLTSLTLSTAGTPNFQTGRRGTFLNIASGINQFVAEVEYIKVWYSAETDGSEPVAAPFATIAGNAAAVNTLTTPFLKSGANAT
jgi:hypothetical protein